MRRTREWHQDKGFYPYLMIRPFQEQWKALVREKDAWLKDMREAMPTYPEARVREVFAMHFECVGRTSYRVRFNRRSARPLEWCPVDFFSKGQALDEGFLRYLLTVNYKMESAERRRSVSLDEYVRIRTEEEDRIAKDTFMLAHRFLYELCTDGVKLHVSTLSAAASSKLRSWSAHGLVDNGDTLTRESLDRMTYDNPLLGPVLEAVCRQKPQARDAYRRIIVREAASRTCFFRRYPQSRFLKLFGNLDKDLVRLLSSGESGGRFALGFDCGAGNSSSSDLTSSSGAPCGDVKTERAGNAETVDAKLSPSAAAPAVACGGGKRTSSGTPARTHTSRQNRTPKKRANDLPAADDAVLPAKMSTPQKAIKKGLITPVKRTPAIDSSTGIPGRVAGAGSGMQPQAPAKKKPRSVSVGTMTSFATSSLFSSTTTLGALLSSTSAELSSSASSFAADASPAPSSDRKLMASDLTLHADTSTAALSQTAGAGGQGSPYFSLYHHQHDHQHHDDTDHSTTSSYGYASAPQNVHLALSAASGDEVDEWDWARFPPPPIPFAPLYSPTNPQAPPLFFPALYSPRAAHAQQHVITQPFPAVYATLPVPSPRLSFPIALYSPRHMHTHAAATPFMTPAYTSRDAHAPVEHRGEMGAGAAAASSAAAAANGYATTAARLMPLPSPSGGSSGGSLVVGETTVDADHILARYFPDGELVSFDSPDNETQFDKWARQTFTTGKH